MDDAPETPATPGWHAAERRKVPRKKSLLCATLVTAEGGFDCRVLDFSSGGAKVEFPHDVVEGQRVTLILERFGTFTGAVAWFSGGCFGMQFLTQSSRDGVSPADIEAARAALKSPLPAVDSAAAALKSPPPAADSAPRPQPAPHNEIAAAQERVAAFLRELREKQRILTLHPGDALFREGSGAIFVVASGLLRMQHGAAGAGNARGQGQPLKSGNAYALTESEVVELDAPRLIRLLEERPAFAAVVGQVVSILLRNMGELGAWTIPEAAPRRGNGAA